MLKSLLTWSLIFRGIRLNSVNHHYVPQLYLRGFTSINGRLQVFDKELNKFKKDKQTPRTVLFEKHRNTINLKGHSNDRIETLYSVIESPMGDFFNYVRDGISYNELVSKEGMYLLKLFIAFQFWRMPLLDDFAENYIKNVDLRRFGERILVNDIPLGNVKEIRDLLDTDSGFRHYFRSFYLPVLTFDTRYKEADVDCWRLHAVSDEAKGWDNFLTGDNPLIIESLPDFFAFKSKFFIPLSKCQLVSYSPNGNNGNDLPAIFSTKLAMVMNSQSQKYVVGANREYMSTIIELQGKVYGNSNVNMLRENLFGYI